MKKFFSRNKKIFGYVVYAFVLTIILLYYRFPSDVFSHYIQDKANQTYPGILLSFERVFPLFPIKLKFQGVEISEKGTPNRQLFSADSIVLGPKILPLFKGDRVYGLDASVYEGKIKGIINYNSNPDENLIATNLDLKGIHIERSQYLSAIMGRRIEGVLEGTIDYQGKENFGLKGSANASFKLSNGQLYLQAPILGLDSIDFDQIILDMALNNQRITLANSEIISQKLLGSVSGTIFVIKDFKKSRIDLQVTVEPYAALLNDLGSSIDAIKNFLKNGKFTFSVRGTISDPRINII
jgi:type II secretion system protein N